MRVSEQFEELLRNRNIIVVSHPYNTSNRNVSGFRITTGWRRYPILIYHLEQALKELSKTHPGYVISYYPEFHILYLYPIYSHISFSESYIKII